MTIEPFLPSVCPSAWSSSQEAGGVRSELHCLQGDLEAPPDRQAAWADQRLPGGLHPAGKRGAARPAAHHGRVGARGPGTAATPCFTSPCRSERATGWAGIARLCLPGLQSGDSDQGTLCCSPAIYFELWELIGSS